MLQRWPCLPLVIGLVFGGYALLQDGAAAGQDNERVAQLIKQLGNGKYVEREKAKLELEAIGMAALGQLRKASKDNDLETAKRCQELIKKLETKMAAEVLLAPKNVKLRFRETPVLQAIQELQKQSGYQIQFHGTQASLLKPTVTLDTGEVTFWDAFDKLCQAASLVEVPMSKSPYSPLNTTGRAMQLVPAQPAMPLPPGGPVPQVGPMPHAVPAPQAMPVPQVVPAPQAVPPGKVLPPVPPLITKVDGNKITYYKTKDAAANQAAGPNQVGQAGQPGVAAAQAVPVQGQVQVQPGNAGAIQFQPAPVAGRVTTITSLPVIQTGIIVVTAGVPERVPTYYHGALRIRLLRHVRATEITVQPRQEGEALFVVEVAAEPRLQQFSVVGMPRVDKAIDDAGQELKMTIEAMAPPVGQFSTATSTISNLTRALLPRQVALRLKLGEKEASTLKELTGTLSIHSLSVSPEALVTLEDITKAVGKSAKGDSGGSIELLDLQKPANGAYKAKIRYQRPAQFFPAANGPVVLTTVNSNQPSNLPTLMDAQGKAFTLHSTMNHMVTTVNGQITQEVTLSFLAGVGVGEPKRMILFGHHMVSAQVPFRFEGVKLP